MIRSKRYRLVLLAIKMIDAFISLEYDTDEDLCCNKLCENCRKSCKGVRASSRDKYRADLDINSVEVLGVDTSKLK